MTLVSKNELNLWHKILPSCKIVFDVGVRNDTTIMGLYPDVAFHVFEPNPASYRSLVANLNNAANVTANNLALGNTTGKLLYYSDTESIARRTHHITSNATPYEINVVTLDDYCAKKQIRHIDFLKIDTEGFELEVMKGGSAVIGGSCRYIQFEYGGTFLDMNITLQDIYTFLEGWKIYRITSTGVEFAPTAQDDYQYCNYLATREGISDLLEESSNAKASQDAGPRADRKAVSPPGALTLEFQNIKTPGGSLKPEFLTMMSQHFNLDTFIETGTFMGDTSSVAAGIFSTVHTVELSGELYQKALARFAGRTNIRVHQGDSARLFPHILGAAGENSLFWLDGHYSEGVTAKGEGNTPIIRELKAIRDACIKNSVILVDDLRMFDTPWDHVPHDSAARGYPGITALCEALLDVDRSYQFAVLGDVLLAYPDRDTVKRSPVLAACTASRLYEGGASGLEHALKAEEAIPSASHEERAALEALYSQFIGSEGFGFGRHYRLWRGLIDAGEKNHDTACKHFLIAINLGFKHWRVQWYLAKAAYEGGLYTLAEKSIAAALKAAPGFQEALTVRSRIETALLAKKPERRFRIQDHLEIAAHLQRAGKESEANSELASAMSNPESSGDVRYDYARLLMKTGQLEAARAHLHKIVEGDPRRSDAQNDLGCLYYEMNDYGKAMEYFGHALAGNSLNYEALKNALALSSRLGIGKDAVPLLKDLMEKHPQDARLIDLARQFVNEQHAQNATRRFEEFVHSVHPQTMIRHDDLLAWAEACESRTAALLETADCLERSDDILVKNGHALAQEVKRLYQNRFAGLKDLRVLIQLPPLDVSPGGYSLFNNMLQALAFTGIQAKALGWNEPIERCLTEFKPTVFMTSDHHLYLSRIDWDAVARYRRNHVLKIGLTASLQEYGNTPLPGRLEWAKQHHVDFFYSFRAPEYLKQRREYAPFFEQGYNVFSIEFGANALIHYPVPGVKRDLDYIFLASSNGDKWQRYFAYLSGILSGHPGFLDGPGWGFLKNSGTLDKDRYLYARAKVGLNLHLQEQIDWPCELNERTYILAACGVPQLIDNPKLLPRRFDERGFFVAHSPAEYAELFEHALRNPDEGVDRALRAQKEVFQSHTWFHRVEGLVLNLQQQFFSSSPDGLVYGTNLFERVNAEIRGRVGRVGGSVGQLLKYDGCAVEDINLEDGGYGRADEHALIMDMHDAHKNAELRDRYDCLVSSNVLEHSYNPIVLLLNFHVAVKKGGWQYHAIPNYRYTYDMFRKPTPLQHFIDDFEKMTGKMDRTHAEDYIQSAIEKHGWQREYHKKYPVAYPYMHNHVFDEHNTRALLEFVFQDVTIDVIRTAAHSDNVVLFRNVLNPAFVKQYGPLIHTYFGNILLSKSGPGPDRAIDQTTPLTTNREASTMSSGNQADHILSRLSKLTNWREGSPLRLHLGCGEQRLAGYVNIDHPPSEHTVQTKVAADFFADITALDFPGKSVDEIRLHHVFEHFNRSVALALLIKWHRWLKLGGTLHIETPDLIGSAKTLLSNASWTTKMGVVRHISGSHEAAWAYHIDQWFPERFEHTLRKLGYELIETRSTSWPEEPYLSNVSVTACKRKDLSPDMLLQAADELLWESTVAPSERGMHEVWKADLRNNLLPAKNAERNDGVSPNPHEVEMNPNQTVQPISGLVFSKDRAMQLDCTLRSFFKHCKDPGEILLTVLYKATTPADEDQYRTLRQEYGTVAFRAENDFKADVLSLLRSGSGVLFLVDDNIFVSDFFLKDMRDGLQRHPDALGFSLRLGRNTTYCYMADSQQSLPSFLPLAKSLLKYVWTTAELDFAYPLELSSSLYRMSDIVPLFERIDFRNPNTLELAMDTNKSLFTQTKNSLLCFERSVAFCNPVNMVQTMWTNRAGKDARYGADKLSELFSRGYRIDARGFAGTVPRSCHQEADFEFIRGTSSSALVSNAAAGSSPLVTIGIANFNGIQHIRLCLDSIRRNTPEPHEIIIVDNGSTDGSREYLREQTDIILVENADNVGAPGARNQFMAIAQGAFIVFLDNDTIVTRDWLTKLTAHMNSDPQIGIIGACSNYATGLQGIPGVQYTTIEALEEYALKRACEHRGELLPSPRLISFCVFIRRAAVDKIGAMETGFSKFCFEDDDYSLRITIAGFRSVVANDVYIHHTGGPQGRGDTRYNKWLIDAWDGFKRKWGLPKELPFGSVYDQNKIISRPFDPNRDYLPLPERAVVEKLIFHSARSPKPRKPGMVSIVLRLTKDLESLKKCLLAVQKHTREPHEIIFIVPRSFHPALKWVKKLAREHSNYTLTEYAEAPGFSREVNQGIRAASGEFVLLLEDGVRVTESWLTGMLECLHASAATGVIGPVTDTLINPRNSGNSVIRPGSELDAYAAAFRVRNRHRRTSQRKIAGFCMLFRYDLVERIGLFDEDLRSGMFSDDDFCLRAALDGFHNMIAGDVFVQYPVFGDHSRDLHNSKKVFDAKWRGIDSASELGKKIVALNTIDTASAWYYQKQQIDKAIASLTEGIKYVPEDPRIYRSLAVMLMDATLFQDALEALNAMPEHAKREARSLELFGFCCEGLGRVDEAAAYADRLRAIEPSSAAALNLRGLLAYKKGDRVAAERFFQEAAGSDPGYGEPLTNLGVMQWANGSRDEALNLLERGFLLSPTVTDCVTLYHNAVAGLGAFSRAEPIFRDAKALFPLNKRVFFLFIDILLQQGKYEDAMQEVEEALLVFDIDDGILPAALQIREKIGVRRLPARPVKRGTLSLCMIVKNEEAHLAKCLMSVKDIADEMVVVDTGSTDKTKDIASAFGARVFDFPWTADFSEARNVSLSKASGDWILVLDGDEALSPIDHAALADLVHGKPAKPVAYSLVTRNYTNLVSAQGWTANDSSYVREETGTGWHPSAKVRLFSNDRRIRFRNPVHEIVEPSLHEAGITIKPCRIPVHHYGKMDAEKTAAKGEEYYLLGRKKLEETGGDARAIQELAIQAGELRRHGESVELWRKLIDRQPNDAHAYFNMGYSYLKLKQYDEALRASKKALELNPDLKEAVLNYANSELVGGDIDKAIAALRNVLQRVPDYPPAIGLLAASLYVRGDREKALEYFKKLTKMGYDCIDYLYDLADMLASERRYKEAVRMLEAAIESNNSHKDTQSLLARCREMIRSNPRKQTEQEVLQ